MRFTKKTLAIAGIIVLFIVIIVFIIYIQKKINPNYEIEILYKLEHLSIWDRVGEKLKKADSDETKILEDRHLDKVSNNPIKLLYGAGEGKMERFSNNSGEVHSTFISIMFYYGIVPTIILGIWIYKNLKGLKLRQLVPYIAIFIESFTLINNRQLFFWVIIIMANLYKIDNYNQINAKEGVKTESD